MTSKFSSYLWVSEKNHNGLGLEKVSKLSDTINCSLLLSKLETYGFSLLSHNLMLTYLYKQFHRTTKTGSFNILTGSLRVLFCYHCCLTF